MLFSPKSSLIPFSQTYHLNRDRGLIADILHTKAADAPLAPYDAICTFVFPDYLALARFLYDKDGAALSDDHENFMDDSQMCMMVGDEYVLIENGEKVVKEPCEASDSGEKGGKKE